MSAANPGSTRSGAGLRLLRIQIGGLFLVSGAAAPADPDIPEDAEVTITQGFFGGYVLEIAAIGRKVKVKRVS